MARGDAADEKQQQSQPGARGALGKTEQESTAGRSGERWGERVKGEWGNCPRDRRCEAKLCLWAQGPGGGLWGGVYWGDSPHPWPLPRVFTPALTASVMPCATDTPL